MKIKNIFFIVIASLALSSCREEIYPDLTEIDPVVVIEGELRDETGPFRISVQESQAYFDSSAQQAVSGGFGYIEEAGGFRDTLTETAPGIYETQNLLPAQGKTYTLFFVANGDTFTATSALGRLNGVDSAAVLNQPARGFLDAGNYVTIHFREPSGKGEFYRTKFYVNDSLYDDYRDISVFDDQLIDGKSVGFELPYPVESGDTVRAELYSISEATFRYYLELQNQLYVAGNPYGAPPGNVPTNITGGGMGVFQTNAVSRLTVIIP